MKSLQQMILARDIIDMIREYKNDANALEYLEAITFSLASVFENKTHINWHDIANVCHQRYYSLQQGKQIALNVEILDSNYMIACMVIENRTSDPDVNYK